LVGNDSGQGVVGSIVAVDDAGVAFVAGDSIATLNAGVADASTGAEFGLLVLLGVASGFDDAVLQRFYTLTPRPLIAVLSPRERNDTLTPRK